MATPRKMSDILLRRGSNSSLRSKNSKAKTDELERAKGELIQLHEENTHLRASLDERNSAFGALETEHEAMKERLHEAEAARDDTQHKCDNLAAQVSQLERTILHLRQGREDAQTELEQTQEDRDALQTRCAAQEKRIAEFEVQMRELEGRIEELEKGSDKERLEAAQAELARTQGENAALHKGTEDLEQKLAFEKRFWHVALDHRLLSLKVRVNWLVR